MIELLSPAGSPEGVIAAVQNGADAVYMGMGAFNARRGAKNFTDEEMTSLQGKGRNEIIESLSKTNIVTDARQNAARLIVPIAVQCGFKEENVTVTIRKELHPGNFNNLIRQLK